MKVIICEEDYSYIELVYSTLFKFAKVKGINAEFNLTTRKPSSIIRFLESDQAELYYISLDLVETMPAIELIKEIREKNEKALIHVMSTDIVKLKDPELTQYKIFGQIVKTTNGSMRDELRKSFAESFSYLKANSYFA